MLDVRIASSNLREWKAVVPEKGSMVEEWRSESTKEKPHSQLRTLLRIHHSRNRDTKVRNRAPEI